MMLLLLKKLRITTYKKSLVDPLDSYDLGDLLKTSWIPD